MTSFLLQIPRFIYDDMLAQAIAELPAECCGLLAGSLDEDSGIAEVTHRYPLMNVLASPTEFISEPTTMFAAVKDMRQNGIEILAVYHSHPTSAPIPSQRDLEQNYSAAVMNLILGWPGTKPEVRGWWLTETDYRKASWELLSDSCDIPIPK